MGALGASQGVLPKFNPQAMLSALMGGAPQGNAWGAQYSPGPPQQGGLMGSIGTSPGQQMGGPPGFNRRAASFSCA
jgi:hypothetical protein